MTCEVDRGVDRAVPDLAVADLDVDRVDEHRGVDLLQRPRGPLGHLRHDLVGDPRDRVLRQRRPVDLGEVGADLSGREALGCQRQHNRVDITQTSLAFGHDHRGEGALPITRDGDLDRPDVVSQHRLGPDPVTGVPAVAAGDLVLVIAQMLRHLLVQSRLDHRLGQGLQHAIGAGQRDPTSAGRTDQLPGDLEFLNRWLSRPEAPQVFRRSYAGCGSRLRAA